MTLTGLNQEELIIFEKAKEALDKGMTAPQFSRLFFSPEGELKRLWATPAEKEKVVQSELYKWLQQQLAKLRTQEAKQFEQEVDQISGRLTVIVPKSLHSALKKEAAREGISLSELVRLKLGYPYQMLTTLLNRESDKISS